MLIGIQWLTTRGKGRVQSNVNLSAGLGSNGKGQPRTSLQGVNGRVYRSDQHGHKITARACVKKALLVIGLGLFPLWIVFLLTLIGMLVSGEIVGLLWLGTAATASLISFPIVLAAAVAHAVTKGDGQNKLIVSGIVAVVSVSLAAILIYYSGLMSGRREAEIDEQRALQVARENTEIAQAVGGTVVDIRIVSVTDERLSRGFDIFTPRYHSTTSSYFIEATGKVSKSAMVLLDYSSGQRTFRVDCCQSPGRWSSAVAR